MKPAETKNQSQLPDEVVARPSIFAWGPTLVCVYLGSSCIFLTWVTPDGTTHTRWILSLVFGTLFLGLITLNALWMRRTQVLANLDGLTFTNPAVHKHIPWDEVTEYYCLDNEGRTYIVKSLNESISFSVRYFRNALLVRQAVAERTKCPKSAWAVKGTRLIDGQMRTFSSKPVKRGELLVPISFGLFGTLTVVSLAFVDSKPVKPASILISLLFAAVVFLPISALMFRVVRRQHEYHLLHGHQRLTLSETGLQWEEDNDFIQANWNEVTEVSVVPIPALVECDDLTHIRTVKGDFSFYRRVLKDGIHLHTFLRAHLPTKTRWVDKTLEPGDHAVLDDGRLLFDYRNRGCRQTALVPTAFAAVFLLVFCIGWAKPLDPNENSRDFINPMLMFLAFPAAAAAICWWHCLTSKVEVGEEYLDYQFPLRTGRVALKSIRAVSACGGIWLEMEDRAIWLPPGISDFGYFKHYLKEKAPWIVQTR